MENSDVFANVTQGVSSFAETLRGFFHSNPYVYAFLLIIVFIYGSQYVPSLPKLLTPVLNNPIAHFLYFYLVCALISPELSMQGAIVAVVVTLVINLLGSKRKAPAEVIDTATLPAESSDDAARAKMLGYEGEEESGATEEFNRRAIEEEYRRQAATSMQSGAGVEEQVPAAHEYGGYAPAFN